MATNEIGEKVYYSDAFVKVTNVRITCNAVSVPVKNIDGVNIRFRIEAYALAVGVFILSLYSFIFCQLVPLDNKTAYVAIIAIAMIVSAFWVYHVHMNYIELELSIGNRRIVILGVGMREKAYICRIHNSLEEALLDEKKYQKMKEAGGLDESSMSSLTETMRLKFLLDDYEKIKDKLSIWQSTMDKT